MAKIHAHTQKAVILMIHLFHPVREDMIKNYLLEVIPVIKHNLNIIQGLRRYAKYIKLSRRKLRWNVRNQFLIKFQFFFLVDRNYNFPFGISEQSTHIFAIESNFIFSRWCTIWSNKLFLITDFLLWYINLVIWKIENRIANKINTWVEFDSYFCYYCSWHIFNYVFVHLLRIILVFQVYQ